MKQIKGIRKRDPILLLLAAFAIHLSFWFFMMDTARGEISYLRGEIKRLTFSKNDSVMYPSMDTKGKIVAYRHETIGTAGEKIASIRVVKTDDPSSRILFVDGKFKAPPPFEDQFLLCGTKPPLISGNGQKVIFSLSLGKPPFLEDHYLGVVNTDGSDLRVIAIKNEEMARNDWKRWGFIDETWRSISQYRISNDGKQIACLVKGHRGARDLSMPSGIVMVQSDGSKQKTLLTPRLGKKGWFWEGFPRRPFTGGGWVFDLSGDGKRVVFGAQSSQGKDDYDLYQINSLGKEVKKITDLKDRWLVRGDISDNGRTISFFYSGKKLQGMGTYVIGFGNKGGPLLLRSQLTDRVDFEEMSGNGKRIFHRVMGKGLAFIEANGKESMIFLEKRRGSFGLNGEATFPYFPSFWNPRFISQMGDMILLEAIPHGKDRRELFLLNLPSGDGEILLTCPLDNRIMDPGWNYCPYDGTPLKRGMR